MSAEERLDGPVRAISSALGEYRRPLLMVLAVAALLLQFQAVTPAVQTVSIAPTAITASVAGISPTEGSSPTPNPTEGTDYVSATTESSLSRMNLASVHFRSADSKAHVRATMTTVALDTTPDTQSFSTVRIPTPSSKEHSVTAA